MASILMMIMFYLGKKIILYLQLILMVNGYIQILLIHI